LHKAGSTKTPADSTLRADGGYSFAHDPDVPAGHEPALWCPEIAPGTLILAPAPEGFDAGASLGLSSLGRPIVDRSNGHDRHLILSDQQGDHTLWLHGAHAARHPAVVLPLDAAFDLRVEVMWRLYRRLRGRPAGPLPRVLQLTPQRRARLILLLHTLDFRLAGARPRDIAAALIDAEAAALPAIEWKSSAVRRKANRLIHDAYALMNGGYRKLLPGG